MAIPQIERMARVSDMLSTAHASLRDRYADRALFLDLLIMTLSLWLTAMAFVDPALGVRLSPSYFGKDLWLGILGVLTFLLSIVQMRVDWKGRADAHARALQAYAAITQECRALMARGEASTDEIRLLSAKYEQTSGHNIAIPEARFLKLKKQHLLKIEVSRLLDTRPGLSPRLLLMKIWWRDNMCNRK